MTDNTEFLAELTPEDVLLYYDGPRVFTARSSKGHLLLVSWLRELDEGERYVVCPISLKTLQALRNNQLTLRDALDSSVLWVVEQAFDGKLVHEKFSSLAEIDQRFPECLPAPGVCLQPIDRGERALEKPIPYNI